MKARGISPGFDQATFEIVPKESTDSIVEDATSYAKVLVRGGPIHEVPLVEGAFYRPNLLEVELPPLS